MAELVDLERFRRKLMADKGFSTWLKRFQEQFGPETRLQDLSPATLLYLATPGEDNLYALFDLVMGAMGLGARCVSGWMIWMRAPSSGSWTRPLPWWTGSVLR